MDVNELDLAMTVAAATAPAELRGLARDEVKLLVLDAFRQSISHTQVTHIADYLLPGDLVVVNNSAMIPGRLHAIAKEQPLVLHLAGKLGDGMVLIERRTPLGEPDWNNFEPGDRIALTDNQHAVVSFGEVVRRFHPRSRLWLIHTEEDWYQLASSVGQPIHYGYVTRSYPMRTYQTIFGSHPGSVEMPSASRPFSLEIMAQLRHNGVEFSGITLHTSVSSHEVSGSWDDHPVIPEWFEVPQLTACRVTAAHRQGRRVIALGTTVVRALESVYDKHHRCVQPASGWTDRLITPGDPPRVVNGLITGLHDNFTSHLAMLYAFVSPEFLKEAYREASARHYLWHEFGDLCLIASNQAEDRLEGGKRRE